MPDSSQTSESDQAKEANVENFLDAECTVADMLCRGDEVLNPPLKRKRGRPSKINTVEGRLARSRQSARDCRVRKKMRYENLLLEVTRMEQENMEMRRQLQQMLGYLENRTSPVPAAILETWRAELLEHDRLPPSHQPDYHSPDEAQSSCSWSSSSSSTSSSSSSSSSVVADDADDEVT